MQIDQNHFPVHTLELRNPKVLILPSQAKSAKVKNVIIGDERPEKKVVQQKVPTAPAKVSTLEGHAKEKKTDNKSQLV